MPLLHARQLFAGSLLGCALSLPTACAMPAEVAAQPPVQRASVTLQRSTCLGNCPGYSVTVTPDGRVSFSGHAHVQTAHAEGHATPDQLASIQRALTESGFATMKSSYTSRNDGCEMVMSDQPGVKITVSDATANKTVDFYESCTGALADAVRPRIEQLAQRIDEALQTAQWIGTPDAPGAAVER